MKEKLYQVCVRSTIPHESKTLFEREVALLRTEKADKNHVWSEDDW